MEAEFEEGRRVTYRENDLWGRTTSLQDADGSVQRTWWHEDGSRAITGTLLGGHIPDGTWSEWDTAGTLVGQVTYTNGEPGTFEGSVRTVLYAGEEFPPIVAGPQGPTLPFTTATVRPPKAVSLVVTAERLSIDGADVVRLTDGVVPDSDLRGSLISPVYDRLVEKAQTAKELADRLGTADAFAGEILIQVDQTVRWSFMRQLLYTAGQAQFSRPMFVGRSTSVQWPPRSGPSWQQGAHLRAIVASEPPKRDRSARPPVLSIAIDTTELVLKVANSADASAPVTVPCDGDCNAGSYDAEALDGALRSIKSAHEPSSTVYVAAHRDTSVQTVISVLDAARGTEDEPLFPSFVLTGGG